ncbi:helix-turn-helix domain-containing protein [Sphingobacterium hotanense]|uniref:Chromosomal replication initiator DnaA C-terminal domain-containing protein n=1 Tax=Sphingobacterium hotanense TaxID=649196 RepID=A0ABT7NLG1_9SPHI|nr:helix-turn-helix domain-containing protein [Sphingobacterium hotanense]MDM1048032.1 hypothetical protein [Sphingobacterium hotanense]
MIEAFNFSKAALVLVEAEKQISNLIGAPIKLNFQIELNREITPDYIIETVSLVSGIPVESIKNESRSTEIVNARFVSFFLMRTYLFMTYKSIGKFFAKDHSSVIHGLKMVNEQFDNIPLQTLKEKCGAKFLTNLRINCEDSI